MEEPMKRLEMHINDNNKWDEFWSYKIELGQDREISKFNYDIWPKLSKNFEIMKGFVWDLSFWSKYQGELNLKRDFSTI